MNGPRRLGKFPWVTVSSLFCVIPLKWVCVHSVTQSCLTLQRHGLHPASSSPHGILQARILEWVAIFVSRGSSQTRDLTRASAFRGRFFITEPPGRPSGAGPVGESEFFPWDFPGVLWPRLQTPNAGGPGFRELDPTCHG